MRLKKLALISYDFVSWFASLHVAALFRFEFQIHLVPSMAISWFAVSLSSASLVLGFSTHLYRERYIKGSIDELRALGTTIFSAAATGAVGLLLFAEQWGIPRSLVFIATPIVLLLSGGMRAYLRTRGRRREVGSGPAKKALIYGAGDAAESLVPQLLRGSESPYTPVALVDDSPEKANRWIRGVPMAGRWEDLSKVVARYQIDAVIVAIPSATSGLLSRVYRDAKALGLPVFVLPSLRDYLRSSRSVAQVRNIGIEDLLGRESIELDRNLIAELIEGKRVLVTGAGGSIGSELAREVAGFEPSLLILADRDETGLLAASMGIDVSRDNVALENYLFDVRDKKAVHDLFRSQKPDVVFHAAALKHVFMLEQFPEEAWKTNVEGTLNLLEASAEVGVSAFVNISTDKAAGPVNALGKSKKLAEEMTAWFGLKTGRAFVSVRFGNVLGSRGSLIPILAEQIGSGGPVTITDRAATRYFMSIPEASQLVLQAAAQGEQGDVLVLDMGEPVNIYEIAQRMIELSGKNVPIEDIGLRPGEKLHEELFAAGETMLQSQHPKILRAKADSTDPAIVLGLQWP